METKASQDKGSFFSYELIWASHGLEQPNYLSLNSLPKDDSLTTTFTSYLIAQSPSLSSVKSDDTFENIVQSTKCMRNCAWQVISPQ